MKNIRVFTMIILLLILLTPILAIKNVYANTIEDGVQEENYYTIFKTVQLEDCNIADPKAVCKIELFGYSSADIIEPRIISRSISTQNVTCGINVVNSLNQVVDQLSQTSTVTWEDWGYSWNNSSRSASTVNGFYSWSNLSGPTPSSGSGNWNYQSSISTNGTMKYLGLNWRTFQVRTTIYGGTNPGIYWFCSWSELY